MNFKTKTNQTRTWCFIIGRSAEHNGNSCPHARKTLGSSRTFQFSSNLKISYLLSEVVL